MREFAFVLVLLVGLVGCGPAANAPAAGDASAIPPSRGAAGGALAPEGVAGATTPTSAP